MLALSAVLWLAWACAVAGVAYVAVYAVREVRYWRRVLKKKDERGESPKDW